MNLKVECADVENVEGFVARGALISYMRSAPRRDIAKEIIFVPAVIYRANVPMY